jgi:phosphatidylglycerophosphate synthase
MLSQRKPLLEKYLEPLTRQLSGVNPNLLTLVGSIPSLLFFVFLISHWYTLALIIFLGMSLDMLDGLVARKYHKTSAFGGFLDSFMDRVSDFFVITAFPFAGLVRWEIAAPLLLFAFLTSYARSRGELAKTGTNFAVGIIERTERLVLIFLALFLYILAQNLSVNGFNTAEIVFMIIVILSLVTVLQRINYAFKHL